MTFVKVTGTQFVRDTQSMGLSNTNESEKNDYYNRTRLVKNQKDEINKVKSELDSIKSDITEIKQLMLQLIDKG